MNIIILGAGKIGTYLARVLSSEQHNVTLIDKDEKSLENASRVADIATRCASGTNWRVLEELLELSPDLFIALTSHDETNLSASLIAKTLGYPKTAARIGDRVFLDKSVIDTHRLFAVDHLIGTHILVAHDLFKAILNPGNLYVETFAHGAAQMKCEIVPANFPFIGKKIKDIDLGHNLLFALIKKNHSLIETIVFPTGEDTIEVGDEVSIIGETFNMSHVDALFGKKPKKIGSATLVGASRVADELISLLLKAGIAVKLLEKEESKCTLFAKKFPSITVIQHDACDFSFLVSEQIGDSDVFVSCSHSDETNILAVSIAKQAGCKELIAVISDTAYAPLLKNLGARSVLSEQLSVSNRIHAILYEKNVTSVSTLYDNQATILEVKVSSKSDLVGIPIAALRQYLPKDLLIGIIENRGRVIIPKGSNILTPGDTVVLISSPKHIKHLESLF